MAPELSHHMIGSQGLFAGSILPVVPNPCLGSWLFATLLVLTAVINGDQESRSEVSNVLEKSVSVMN